MMATKVSSRLKLSIPLKVSSPAVNYRIIIDSSYSQYFKLAFLRGPDNNLSIFVFSPSFPLSSPSSPSFSLY